MYVLPEFVRTLLSKVLNATLVEANRNGSNDSRLSEEELVAQIRYTTGPLR